jgi:hypothetical protein
MKITKKNIIKSFAFIAIILHVLPIVCFGSGRSVWISSGVAVSTAASRQDFPQIISDGTGGAIICWQDYRDSKWDIYAQDLNEDGGIKWTINGSSVADGAYDQEKPVMVEDPNGGAIIAWWDKRDGTYYDIYAQKINSSGSQSWVPGGIVVSTGIKITDIDSSEYDLAISTDGSGGAIITWVDNRTGGNNIYAQRISTSGASLWGVSGTTVCSSANTQDSPVIAPDETGGAIIAWQDYRNSNWDIYALRISSDGSVSSGWTSNGIMVSSNTSHDKNPVIIPDQAGGSIIAWERMVESGAESGLYDIYAQRISSAGVLGYGGTNKKICDATGHQLEPEIMASDTAGTCIIAWQDFRSENFYGFGNSGNEGDIYAQRMDSNGNTTWPSANGIAVCAESDTQENVKMTSDNAGGAIFVWQDEKLGIYDIFAQKVSVSGSVNSEWGNEQIGTVVSTFTNHQKYPQIISDGISGAIICYGDPHTGGDYQMLADIYAQRITDPDEDPPQTITTLSALIGSNSDEVVLSWIAPDGDGISPAGTPAHHYILKYSTVSVGIDIGNAKVSWWDNTAETYEQNWSPLTPGTTEQKSIYLLSSTTYYFVLQAVDAANNKSLLDAAKGAKAPTAPDTDDPSKIQNSASTTGSTEGKINLSWSAPGDNGINQKIISGKYYIQHSTNSSVSWSTAAAQVAYDIEDVEYGDSQSRTITGLIPGSTYYFRLWTEDEVPNISLLSDGTTCWAQWDITAPATSTIISSQVQNSSTSVKLSWNAPGDDGNVNYNTVWDTGTYKIQYSTFSLGSISWSLSSYDVAITTYDVIPGEAHSYTVTGLNADTEYHFRLWTGDEKGNWSSYSNIASTETLDFTPPGVVTGFAAVPGDYEAQIKLSWVAPGDNGYNKTMESGKYRIEYSSWAGTVWSSNTATGDGYYVTLATSNVLPGELQSHVVTGLIRGTTYFFRVWACDEVPNWSGLSLGATTYAQLDLIAPATTLDLGASPGDSYVSLSWTAPGDNGNSYYFVDGGSYTIRYSTIAQITDANWDNSSIVRPVTELAPAPTIPVPLTPLVSETASITGLTNYKVYWFALKTRDEDYNWSGLSNVISAVPTPDLISPTVQLTYTPPGIIYVLGNKVIVKAQASDSGSGVISMKLYYRKIGDSSYVTYDMYSSTAGAASTGELTGEIPASYMTSAGIEYYVEVKDKSQNWWFSTGQTGTYSSSITPTPHQVQYSKTYTCSADTTGQTINLPDGNSNDGCTAITVPAGALKEQVSLFIAQETASLEQPRGSDYPVCVFDFTPDGQMFKKSVTIKLLYFDLDGDGTVDGTTIDEDTLKVFWWDGFEWRYVGGSVDAQNNTVSANTMHFSKYALFGFSGSILVEDCRPMKKIVTPNDDGINDCAEFSGLEPPYELKIYNIRGREIWSISDISNPIWDATDEDGDIVESGTYIYQLDKDGELVSGVIVIAK